MQEVQCTKWLKKNLKLRLGEARFPEDKSRANYAVPKPKKVMNTAIVIGFSGLIILGIIELIKKNLEWADKLSKK